MRKRLLISIIALTLSTISFSQVTNDISQVSHVTKGKIILNDGSSLVFRNLSVKDSVVTFTDSQLKTRTYPGSEVYKISRTGNYALLSAVTCGLGGLAGGILGTANWSDNPELSGKESSYIIGATLVSTGIGALVGALIKKDKTVYKSSTSFTFNLIPAYNQFNKTNLVLTCRINLN